MTDQNGNVIARHGFLPFGEEIPANTAGRNGQWGLTSDVEQKFTGQIRDNETGMDYFNARYFASPLGRFNSADPANAGADMTDPQTWNAYGYIRNNPLALTDPDGQCFWCWFAPVLDVVAILTAQPEIFGLTAAVSTSSTVATATGIAASAANLAGAIASAVGGSGGGGSSRSTTPASSAQTSSTGLPPGSFPNGETAGLPPGMRMPGPLSPRALFGLWDWHCSNGFCVPLVNDFDPSQIEQHHVFSRQFADWFAAHGIDIDSWLVALTARMHRLAGGIHTKGGGNWNAVWKQWIEEHPYASRQEIVNQAKKMMRDFGIAGSDLGDMFIIVNPCVTTPSAPFCQGAAHHM